MNINLIKWILFTKKLNHIIFIQKIIQYSFQNRKYKKMALVNEFKCITNSKMLSDLIKDLEDHFNVKFDIFI